MAHLSPNKPIVTLNMGFPGGSAVKESACNAGDLGLIPGLGRSPGEGNGNPLQYSGLENSMDCIVYGVTKSWTRQSDYAHTTMKNPHVFPVAHLAYLRVCGHVSS